MRDRSLPGNAHLLVDNDHFSLDAERFMVNADRFMVVHDHFLLAHDRFPVDADHFSVVHERFLVDSDHFSVACERFSFGVDRFLVDCSENVVNRSGRSASWDRWQRSGATTATLRRAERSEAVSELLTFPSRESMPSIAAERGKKARVFERSEFRAAPIREKRRAPMRLHRIGTRPAEAVLVTFAAPKVTRTRSVWKPLFGFSKQKIQGRRSFRAPAVPELLFFACAKKSNQKRHLSNSRMAGQAHPGRMPALRAGPPLPGATSTVHPCTGEKRRAPARRPAGIRAGHWPCFTGMNVNSGKRKTESGRQSQSWLCLTACAKLVE